MKNFATSSFAAYLYAILVALTLLLGISTADAANYAGTYSGTFLGGNSGTWTFTVSSNGAITGTTFSNINGSTQTLSGQVSSNGSIAMATGPHREDQPLTAQSIQQPAQFLRTYTNSYSRNSGGFSGAKISDLPPSCTLTANPASIATGGSSTLMASCSPAATSYVWAGGTCAGTSDASCTVMPTATTTYSVTGSNAAGSSSTASATVTPFTVQAAVVSPCRLCIVPPPNVVQAVISYNSADLNKTGSVYIFAYLDANSPLFGTLVKASSSGKDFAMAGNTLILAVYNAVSGWQKVISGNTVGAFFTGALNSSNNAFSLYVQDLFNQLQDNGIICVSYTTSTGVNTTDKGLPVVIGKDPAVNCPTVTLASTAIIEFYNINLDNYFITANSDEATAIDGGSAGPGWSRTGNTFNSGGHTPVCRFYGSLSPGPNSHFYTADAGECAYLKQLQATTPATQKRWNFESNDFLTTVPTTTGVNGICPTGTTPVYRAYNNGFARGVDSNHRITSSQMAIQQVVSKGWVNEGVVMCAPQ